MSDRCITGPAEGARNDEGDQCYLRGPADLDLSLDEVFSLLGDRQRRLVLRYFVDNDGTETHVDDLVAFVVQWERELGQTPDRDGVAIALHHSHLPKLAAAGVVEVDDGSTVRDRGSDRLERFVAAAMREGPLP